MPPSGRADPVIDAVAGVAGALLALTATYPLITLNTRQHTTRRTSADGETPDEASSQPSLPSTKDIEKLYRGIYPAMIGTAASQAVYNYWYSRLGTTYRTRTRGEPSAGASLAIASVAGCVNVLMTLPIWTIVAKMQADVKKRSAEEAEADADVEEDISRAVMEKRRHSRASSATKKSLGFFDIAREVYHDGGVAGFWQGLAPSLVMVSNPALQYALYETSASWTLKRGKRPVGSALSAGEVFMLGAFAKFGATMVTYPILVVKSRLQVMSKDMADERMRYRGTAHAITCMAKDEGLGVFYKGLSTKLTQTILAAALMFTAKEKLAEKIYAASFALKSRALE